MPYEDPLDQLVDLLRSRHYLAWRRLAVLGDSVTAGVMQSRAGYRERSFADRLAHALAATRDDFTHTNLATPSRQG